jgi:hypothetical protein
MVPYKNQKHVAHEVHIFAEISHGVYCHTHVYKLNLFLKIIVGYHGNRDQVHITASYV